VKAGRKPGSVPHRPPQPGLNGRWWWIISLGPTLPPVSSGAQWTERDVANLCSVGRSPGLAPGRGLPSRHLSMPLVRSYRTFAPLPVRGALPPAIGGVFLWHCPHGVPHWALPSRPGHSGARTFLNRIRLAHRRTFRRSESHKKLQGGGRSRSPHLLSPASLSLALADPPGGEAQPPPQPTSGADPPWTNRDPIQRRRVSRLAQD